MFLCAVELWVTEGGGVPLEWRVLLGICVCTFWAAFVELCVEAQLLVGTTAGRVSSVSGCVWGGRSGVGVGGPAPRGSPAPGGLEPCGAPEPWRDSWDPRGLARAAGAPQASPARGQVRAAHVDLLFTLARGEDPHDGHPLLPSGAEGRRIEPFSRVRSPGIAVTRTGPDTPPSRVAICLSIK